MAWQTDVVVIGAGQAGLVTSRQLKLRGIQHVVLDAVDTVGQSWRGHWDSFTLSTPTKFTSSQGFHVPTPAANHPGKDAIADSLHTYAAVLALPVVLNAAVTCLSRSTHPRPHYWIRAGDREWEASAVVLAAGSHHVPHRPAIAYQIDPNIEQLHSADYRRPAQLGDGSVLVVGAGNSGAEIALELAQARRVWLSGPDVGRLPGLGPWTYPLLQASGRLGIRLARLRNPGTGDPLVRIGPEDLDEAGIIRLPRLIVHHHGLPEFPGRGVLKPAAIIWATGFHPDWSWLDLPGHGPVDRFGLPRVRGGVFTDHPGLYAVGLRHQRSLTSHLLGGVEVDAIHVVQHLDQHLRRHS